VGPRLLGLYNPRHRLDTMFLPHACLKSRSANVAVVSQSGAVMICLLEAIRMANTGISKVVNYGNAVDLDAPEVYEYLAMTRHRKWWSPTGVGGRRRRFLEAARFLSDRKPSLYLKRQGGGRRGGCILHTDGWPATTRFSLPHEPLRTT
jgi:acetyl-CoA synthetase (ADP-forming)/acetyltransferase